MSRNDRRRIEWKPIERREWPAWFPLFIVGAAVWLCAALMLASEMVR